jgi:hypothetical protein
MMKMKVQMELTLMAMVLVDNIHQGIWRTLRITQPIIKNSSSTSSKMVATKKKPTTIPSAYFVVPLLQVESLT